MRGLLYSLLPLLLLLLQPWETQLQFAGPRCSTGPLDLVFVIDSSRSVRPFEFETMRQFLVGLLRSLDVGPNATRVGVIQYSSQVQSVFPLRAFSRREDMERAIRALVPLAQGTMTGLAIQYAMNVAFSVAEGARPPEARVPRVAVIVTDGRPQDRVAEGGHGCQHQCVSAPGTFHCACNPGYQLAADNKSCVAIDHCSFGNHSCQHDCVSTFGGPQCRCREGYDLLPDGRSCQARDLCNGVDHGCEFQCVSEGFSYRCMCPEGRQLQADGKSCSCIVMYAVGVGKAVEEELREIASEPAELHVSYSPDFSTMTHLLENLKGSICPEEGIGAGTELRSPCECESLVEFQGRTLGALESLSQKHILWVPGRGPAGRRKDPREPRRLP
ncbi:MATN4 [Cervus elaphus hippelaphus]|uniref:MATN4 n=1 Tax=Cervus elaphus hippelaphus TaxID=46360 RepID=A0A212CB30_CEREH|nr:MATN4 [Cervus elaphus hippelaphus]